MHKTSSFSTLVIKFMHKFPSLGFFFLLIRGISPFPKRPAKNTYYSIGMSMGISMAIPVGIFVGILWEFPWEFLSTSGGNGNGMGLRIQFPRQPCTIPLAISIYFDQSSISSTIEVNTCDCIVD